MKKLSVCLWVDNQAEEMAKFYSTVFKDFKRLDVTKYTADNPSDKKVGSVMTTNFEINGIEFMALNGGPYFKMNEAISIMIHCENQKEVDYYFEKLSAVPESEQCGWVKDKFGLSWQVIPTILNKLVSDPDKEKSKRAMEAMLKMKKLDIQKLQDAFDGK